MAVWMVEAPAMIAGEPIGHGERRRGDCHGMHLSFFAETKRNNVTGALVKARSRGMAEIRTSQERIQAKARE